MKNRLIQKFLGKYSYKEYKGEIIMDDKLDKINLEIKATWKKFFRSFILSAGIFALIFYIFYLAEKKYNEEIESTTWYEAVAQFDHSFCHKEKKDDDYEYVDYYDWHFTYVGHDGNTYDYIEKNNLFVPDEGYKITIYVDEKDNSHSLKIKNYSDTNFVKKTFIIVIIIVISPHFIAYLISFIILYIRRFITKKQLQ